VSFNEPSLMSLPLQEFAIKGTYVCALVPAEVGSRKPHDK
jgi:hypothetical protein